jgi:hypothetical protein
MWDAGQYLRYSFADYATGELTESAQHSRMDV